jgi:hypothetical protein
MDCVPAPAPADVKRVSFDKRAKSFFDFGEFWFRENLNFESQIRSKTFSALQAFVTAYETGEGGHPLPPFKVFRQENSMFSGTGRPCRL